MKQLSLPQPTTWGGRRKGAGRKPGRRPSTLHRQRPDHKSRHPAHVTLRARSEVGSLRATETFAILRRVIDERRRANFRMVHFCVQGDHLHLIVEAHDKEALSSGMRSFMIRAARALNKELGRRGKVWADRYHTRALRTPREVRNALAYVFGNAARHGRRVAVVDPCSSAAWFDGWRSPPPLLVDARFVDDEPPVAPPRTWLLGVGWRKHGLISWSDLSKGAGAG